MRILPPDANVTLQVGLKREAVEAPGPEPAVQAPLEHPRGRVPAPSPEGCPWRVVGGEDKGGILVKEGESLASAKAVERLATGALVWELELREERLHYELIVGTGPPTGWVSIRLYHKDLLLQDTSAKASEQAKRWRRQRDKTVAKAAAEARKAPDKGRPAARQEQPEGKAEEAEQVARETGKSASQHSTGSTSEAGHVAKPGSDHRLPEEATCEGGPAAQGCPRQMRGETEATQPSEDKVSKPRRTAPDRSALLALEPKGDCKTQLPRQCAEGGRAVNEGATCSPAALEQRRAVQQEDATAMRAASSEAGSQEQEKPQWRTEASRQEAKGAAKQSAAASECPSLPHPEPPAEAARTAQAGDAKAGCCIEPEEAEKTQRKAQKVTERCAAVSEPSPVLQHDLPTEAAAPVEHAVAPEEVTQRCAAVSEPSPVLQQDLPTEAAAPVEHAAVPEAEAAVAAEQGAEPGDSGCAPAPEEPSEEPPAPEGRLWMVVGGEDRGGILVREGEALSSDKEDERLATGSLVWELVLKEDRLHYELVKGSGPSSGWVSLRLYHKELLTTVQTGVTREMVLSWAEEDRERERQEAEEQRRREEEERREAERREAQRRETERREAERRNKEAAERAAREMARLQKKDERERQKKQEQEKRMQEKAQKRAQRAPEPTPPKAEAPKVREWDKTELDKLEVCFALNLNYEEMVYTTDRRLPPKGQQDLMNLKRYLIKKLRREEDEQMSEWDIPSDELRLLGVCEKIFEIEGLRDVVFPRFPSEELQRQAFGELLSAGVGSVMRLSRFSVRHAMNVSILQGPALEALLQASGRRIAEGSRICELASFGKAPFLVTAPHNAFLLRDGQTPHQLEQFTSQIAVQLARELEGEALCWTRQVQWRSAFRFALGLGYKKKGTPNAVEQTLDKEYRDPNYLHQNELNGSPWFRNMRNWLSRQVSSDALVQLHVDVHGCQDPPMWPTHAILGLGAMRQNLEELSISDDERRLLQRRLDAFAELVEPSVANALSPLLGVFPREAASLRGLAAAVTETGERAETLSGAWPPGTGRLTQTQQSVSHAGISHALQLELSLSLRRALIREPWAIRALADALRNSWLKAIALESYRGSYA